MANQSFLILKAGIIYEIKYTLLWHYKSAKKSYEAYVHGHAFTSKEMQTYLFFYVV